MIKLIKKIFLYIFIINFPLFLFVNFSNISFAKNYNKNALLCKPSPEGIEFGLWFEDNNVSQIGIENFKIIIDYKEPFKVVSEEEVSWLRVTLDINSLELKLGSMNENFAKCIKVKSLDSLMNRIKEIINYQMQENTI